MKSHDNPLEREIQNPKLEIRNRFNWQKPQNWVSSISATWSLELASDFDFWISDLNFSFSHVLTVFTMAAFAAHFC
jgi:hypothetical protein